MFTVKLAIQIKTCTWGWSLCKTGCVSVCNGPVCDSTSCPPEGALSVNLHYRGQAHFWAYGQLSRVRAAYQCELLLASAS